MFGTQGPKSQIDNVSAAAPMFDIYLSRWNLVPDGAPITTHAARLLPVRQAGVPAMLKVAVEEDERQGGG
ncbi:Aminoglycoside/hydroxyurea antibiotic resistance kinase [Achromobacter ruhlandii]|nr:Aminoglycoside/hydroxyurea antibiotic resistance kinase [Achromobacter ruhlandii]CUJ62358.1 Aminoglycoside/hydroxyurea antibiotic resistance kinase [Achromobacter ruhlandii]CUJ98006.1 Aminoglycoside/hydroxyurea antibiotic resistance kinase [Achromobacter ruhlandii]